MRTAMEPSFFVNGWRFLNAIVLAHLWVIGDATRLSFVFVLLMILLASLRWRFSLPAWTVVMDLFISLLFIPYSSISYYGLAFPLFELVLRGKWLYSSLLFIGGVILFLPSEPFLFWYLLQAAFFGAFSNIAIHHQQHSLKELDALRKSKYELERVKSDLLKMSYSSSQQAQIMERNRISRELHDHLGHDLTGAALAIQAYEHMEDPEEANKLLGEVKKRIERSTISLRETVHNMLSTELLGVDRMKQIVNDFKQFETSFQQYGDMSRVSAYVWALLEACLKEALTNIVRHSNASKADIDLQVTHAIVRLSIRDNGEPQFKKSRASGSGLRSLQMRARSLNGSLSITHEDGFLLVCVIPLEEGDERK